VLGGEVEGWLLVDYWKSFCEEIDLSEGDGCHERYAEDDGFGGGEAGRSG